MRVSTNMIYHQSLQHINNAQENCMKSQSQLASGKIVNKPSDEPYSYAQTVRLGQLENCNQQYMKNRNLAEMGMKLQMDILSQMNDVMIQIDTTIIQASNQCTLNERDNVSLAEQLNSLKDQLVALANTTDGNGRYIFAGFKSDKPPFIKNVNGEIQYQGSDKEITQRVSSNNEMTTYFMGKNVFSTDENNVVFFFKTLDIGIKALNKSKINISQSELDIIQDDINKVNREVKSALEKISNIEMKQGLQLQYIERLNFQCDEQSIQNKQQISKLSEINLVEGIMIFNKEMEVLQASQDVFKKLNKLSLFN
ncbi:flagellar hook-associated protein FlgL [Providencia sneebia]|uniref:Flagellar hook-associated protein 3 n=1 Tax=Providencia sneebia DSM 19967 TaxID=1141660 RepID=K8WF63_9GAMM|nr:flagellar hook-associated protein FlgL [Providencia sneebia]EKT58566.1 flagellar hook-associated protein 3 [Providencia sneebia DSM 19967]